MSADGVTDSEEKLPALIGSFNEEFSLSAYFYFSQM